MELYTICKLCVVIFYSYNDVRGSAPYEDLVPPYLHFFFTDCYANKVLRVVFNSVSKVIRVSFGLIYFAL